MGIRREYIIHSFNTYTILILLGELKTKPTQHSVKTLLESGIQPDILVCRTEHPLNSDLKRKIARFCNVEKETVIESMDDQIQYMKSLYLQKEGLDKVVLRKLGIVNNTVIKLQNGVIFLKVYKIRNKKLKLD